MKLPKVKIRKIDAHGEQFSPLIPGSIHQTVKPPKEHKHLVGFWVMGKSEPVRLLYGEYDIVE